MSLPVPYYRDESVTIYNADALDILPYLEGIDAVSTDPPYSSGGAFRSDRVKKTSAKYTTTNADRELDDFSGDNRDQRSFLAWCVMWLSAARHAMNPAAPIMTFIDWRQLPTMTDALQCAGFIWQGIAPWCKPQARPRPNGFSQSAEFVVWGTNGPMGLQDNTTAEYVPGHVIELPAPEIILARDVLDRVAPASALPGSPGFILESPPKARVHSAQKPEKVARWQLSILKPGSLVLDPFIGSGTSLRAAKDMGMRAIGIDMDLSWCKYSAELCAQRVLLV